MTIKYAYIALIFVAGVAVGRWSGRAFNSESFSSPPLATSSESAIDKELSSEVSIIDYTPDPPTVAMTPSEAGANTKQINSTLLRTSDKAKDKEIRSLYSKFIDANQRNNVEDQNSLFAEMERLDPKHENVFQAKARFLEDDDNWEGAYNTYKECVSAVPTSVPCLSRLTNIRTSTLDDKIKYGMECLNIEPMNPNCLVDVAITQSARGEYLKAKEYFEKALSLPKTGLGYYRDYILFHYGMTLKNLSLFQEAKKAFTESCRLKMKSACDELK